MGKTKKSRRKKLILWLCLDVTVAAIVIALLLYKPAHIIPWPRRPPRTQTATEFIPISLTL